MEIQNLIVVTRSGRALREKEISGFQVCSADWQNGMEMIDDYRLSIED